MRMILALSACDMHRNGLIVRSQDHGRYHYSQAVKEFRQLLETPRQVSLDDVETVFATVFLMIAWEWQFGHSVRHVRMLLFYSFINRLTEQSFNSTCRAYAHFWKRIRNYSASKM